MSYNILAQCYVGPGKLAYAHSPPACLLWETRGATILREILERSPDILVLQEVMFDSFDDIRPKLAAAGYAGRIQNGQRRTKAHRHGNATVCTAVLLLYSRHIAVTHLLHRV
jgi:mRNA deadenylase 3'-5' endonuclease subunit Ccr4